MTYINVFAGKLTAKARIVYLYFCRLASGRGTAFPAGSRGGSRFGIGGSSPTSGSGAAPFGCSGTASGSNIGSFYSDGVTARHSKDWPASAKRSFDFSLNCSGEHQGVEFTTSQKKRAKPAGSPGDEGTQGAPLSLTHPKACRPIGSGLRGVNFGSIPKENGPRPALLIKNIRH
jgi:hypothetical protein